MRKAIIWGAVVLALVAAPAIVGVLVVGGDDGRRAAALVPAGKTASSQYQLVIDGLTPTGQAIVVDSYSWGVEAPVDATGQRTGKVKVSALTITKKLDQASALLLKSAVQGTNHPGATLTLFTVNPAIGTPAKYMTYRLSDVSVSGVQHTGSGGDIPAEQATIHFGRVEVESSGVDAKGGVTAPTQFAYDVSAVAP